ncbi:MAG TPA: hypothetical protein PL040_07105 [Bacteroidales bacterium]|nr:hypothetical protein [Bacteroidales bacterium]
MKKLLLLFAFTAVTYSLFSQVPQGFNYQAIARDNTGNPITNATLWVRLSILSDTTGFYSSGSGTYVWEETHTNVKTNSFGMFTVVLGTGTKVQGSAATFSAITWTPGPYYVGTKISQNNGSTWKIMGSAKLWTVPYAMVAAKADGLNSGAKVVSTDDGTANALFEVKRKDGQTVFAVYPDAVHVFVPTGSKANKGGFAIGGFGEKAPSQDYFRVTPDSVRIYIDNSPSAKGAKGGFAIGGFDGAKGTLLRNFYMNVSGTNTVDTVKGSPQVLWFPNKNAFLAGNVWIGSADSVGLYSTALGYRSIARGDYSQAFGFKAKALGNYSTSIGKNSIAGAGKTIAQNAFAFGDGAKATGSDSYALGSGAEATGYRSFAFGSVSIDTLGNPLSTPTRASGSYATAIGMGAQASNTGAIGIGVATIAQGAYTSSFGWGATSLGNYATALGFRAYASGANSTAVGYYSYATASYGHAFGYRAYATGTASLSLGFYANASKPYSTAMGYYAAASGDYSTAIGYQAKATTANAFSFGYNSEAAADNSFAIGTYGLNSDGTVNTSRPTKTTGTYSVAMGMGAQASQKGSMAFGVNTTASGVYSTAMGYGPTSSGQYSMALGYQPVSSGNYSTAIGYSATSGGPYSTAMGYAATSPASYSVAIGMGASTSDGTQMGTYATAIGYNSRAWGNKSLAIGSQYTTTILKRVCNKITGICYWLPSSLNVYNTATGDYSIAIGNGNTASGGGMALGFNNTARSIGAVAFGHSNVADSAYSMAVGSNNNATGYNAFAFGESLIAQSANSFVVGTYNIATGDKTTWNNNDPLFVVGNGDSNTRHDALKVLKSGALYVYPDSATYGTYISTTNTSYGLYIDNYAQLKAGTSSLYGIRNSATQNNASASGSLYSQLNYGNNYGTGSIYGIVSYAYQFNASATSNVYSGYFYSYKAGTGGTNYGLYANIRSGASIDVAEYIHDSYGNTQPADVVVADPARTESVIKSSKPYQTGILGVISTNPHLTMGMELVIDEKTGESKKGVSATKLALTGRVPVNVTGENGPIQPGDYLTSSSTPGCAMKWSLLDVNDAKDFEDLKRILAENERRRGAILGKAVEGFSGTGTGKIMVLISLQ